MPCGSSIEPPVAQRSRFWAYLLLNHLLHRGLPFFIEPPVAQRSFFLKLVISSTHDRWYGDRVLWWQSPTYFGPNKQNPHMTIDLWEPPHFALDPPVVKAQVGDMQVLTSNAGGHPIPPTHPVFV